MKIKTIKFLQYFALLIFCVFEFFIHPGSVNAAGYGISLNPPLLRVNIKPGKSISQVFTITNLTGDDKLLIARIVPFSQADMLGNPVIDLKSTPSWLNNFNLANSDIKLGSPFTIKGNSSEQLILNLTVPENSPLRDVYATLLISTYLNTVSQGFLGSQVSATIGSNLLITINSELNPSTILKINHVAPVTGTFFKLGNLYLVDNITPITFSASVKNDGNFTAESKGVFKILGRKDDPVYLEGILPVYLIAHTERELFNGKGQYFSFTPNLGNLGPHKAILQIKTENSNAENSIDIFFFPFKISIGIILSLALLNTIVRINKKTNKTPIDNE